VTSIRYVVYVLTSAIAAAAGMILTEIALRYLSISSLLIAVPSNSVGGLFILTSAWLAGSTGWRRWPRADWTRLAAAAVAIYALGFFLMYEAVQRIGSGKAALLGRLEVLIVVGLAVLFLGERWSRRHWLATLLAVGGATLVNFDSDVVRLSLGVGEILILLAALVYAIGIVTLKSLVDRQDGQVVTGYGLLLGAGMLLPFAWTDGWAWLATEPSATSGVLPGWAIGALLGARGVLLGISWVTYNVAMKHIGASRCSVLFLSVVLFTVLLQLVVDGLAPGLGLQVPPNLTVALLGGAIIGVAVFLIQAQPPERQP
jgi:drug/metabolite transporter (DMT)-like permease